MIQHTCEQRQRSLRRNPLLERHPVLAPLLLMGSALVLGAMGYFANSLFPVFVLIGAPTALVYLLLALVLGMCGILATIINILEFVDRWPGLFALASESKEHSYD